MASPENNEKDLEVGNALVAPDGNEMSNEFIGANEHDILWIDAVTDASASGGGDFGDWTQAANTDAGAQQAMDQWIASGDGSTGEEALFEDGLMLTSIDGLPW